MTDNNEWINLHGLILQYANHYAMYQCALKEGNKYYADKIKDVAEGIFGNIEALIGNLPKQISREAVEKLRDKYKNMFGPTTGVLDVAKDLDALLDN